MKNKGNCLSEKFCLPCRGGVPALKKKGVSKLLAQLNSGWDISEDGYLLKKYHFTDFKCSMDFANAVAKIAEEEMHHPSLKISWGQCEVEIWTHKINGLTESDFILAAKIEGLSSSYTG